MAKSIAHGRKITVYPDENLKQLVIAESAVSNISRSDVVSDALKQRYATMPEDVLKKIVAKADALSKYPKR